jgi:hypothetical protein
MKTKLTLLTLLIFVAVGVKAQNLIAVQHVGKPTFYTKLPDAITGALAGDTVYIPGGSYPAIAIGKKLYLIGVGHNPDSTNVTYRTIIASITLNTGADNGLISGVEASTITINSNLTGNIFSRCNIGEIYGVPGFVFTNFSIVENILGYIILPGTNHSINNNIITGLVYSGGNISPITNCILRNNLFLNPGVNGQFYTDYTLNTSYCTIENNIFENSSLNYSGSNDVLNNNVNVGSNGFSGNDSQGSGNFLAGVNLSTIFPTYSASIVSASADGIYTINFNLPTGSPYKNAGRDGTDIGLYGGVFPWKPGSVPFNPHFQSVKVSPQTDSSGNLKVQITVAAQNN